MEKVVGFLIVMMLLSNLAMADVPGAGLSPGEQACYTQAQAAADQILNNYWNSWDACCSNNGGFNYIAMEGNPPHEVHHCDYAPGHAAAITACQDQAEADAAKAWAKALKKLDECLRRAINPHHTGIGGIGRRIIRGLTDFSPEIPSDQPSANE